MALESSHDGLRGHARAHMGRNLALSLYIAAFASAAALGGKELLDKGADLLGIDAQAGESNGGPSVEDGFNVPAWAIGTGGGLLGAAAWVAAVWVLIYWRFGSRRGPRVARRFF